MAVITIDMNNPTCGDRIHLTFQVEDGIVKMQNLTGKVVPFQCHLHQ